MTPSADPKKPASPVRIAAIVPSWSGEATASLDSLAGQTWPPAEIELVVGVSPNGRARNVGVARTNSDYLLFLDDDARLATADALENLVRPLVENEDIHITGASKLIPLDASPFQRRIAREIPRIEHAVVTRSVRTRPAPPDYYSELTTTCCAMRRSDFERLGGFSEALVRGVDTEFFVRADRAGLRLLLVANTWTWHPAPANLRGLLRKHFLYGLGHAQEIKADPSRARGLQRRPILYLLFRTAVLIPNIFFPFSYAAPDWRPGFKPLKALTSYVGALGFFWGSLTR